MNGFRHLLQNFDQTIDVRLWHTLRVSHQDCRVNIFYDDKQVFDLCDKTFHAGTERVNEFGTLAVGI